MRRIVLVVGSALVAWVLVVPTSGPAGAQANQGTGGDAKSIEAGRALIAHVPEAVRPGCTMHNVQAPGSEPELVASIDCSVTRDGAAYTLSYSQYETVDDMQGAYDELVAEPIGYDRPEGCEEGGTYSVDDETVGSWSCIPSADATSIVYTYEPLGIVASLDQVFTASGGTDTDALDAFWNDYAGPNSRAGTVPSLVSGAAAKRARSALLARIPAAIRPQCEPNRQSFESPWVAAEFECEHPSPGVWLVRYTSYRDADGFAAGYEEERFLALHDAYETDDCPDSGTWGSGKKTRGRFACTVDETNSYVLWTSDREGIVAYAFAQADDMTTSDFLEWWNGEAGPLA